MQSKNYGGILRMNESEEFFNQKHKTLYSAAKWAHAFAWISLIVLCISSVTSIIESNNLFHMNAIISNYDGLFEFLADHPMQWFAYGINWIVPVVRGLALFILLKGVSFALNMIVETDLNFRERLAGEKNVE
jgi:hypothetical protein